MRPHPTDRTTGLPPPPALHWLRRAAACALAALALSSAISLAWDRDRMAQAAARTGPRAVAAVKALQPLLLEAAGRDEQSLLVAINDFFNRRVVFTDDRIAWGQDDHWASPLETLEKGQGDCEDYAIAKYASLLAAGTAPERLRLVYVRAQQPRQPGTQAHMVLAYYASFGAEPLILDNLSPEVLPASRRPDLAPVFSFSAVGLWQAGGGGARASDALRRLSKWRDVWSRTRAEGWP